jgi:putative SOS response-associated peptidase YedK
MGEVEKIEWQETRLLKFTVITSGLKELGQPLHDRMPVIIAERDYDRWMKAHPPFDADKMTSWKVDKET